MTGRVAFPAALMAIAACGSNSYPTGSGGPPPPPVATNAVDVRDNRFDPAVASVGTAAAVTWTWRGGNEHNVTFEDGRSSSGTMRTGSHQRTFNAAGTFRYRCTIHSTSFTSGMVGSVQVQ